jgi:hypothetical protein
MRFEQSPSKPEIESGKEKERGFDLDFYITDHSADSELTGSPEKLHELYADIKKDGIESVRYDWRWRAIEPQQGEYSADQLARYSRAKDIMREAGLKEPTIILSDLPEWAKKLYKENKEGFFEEYAKYVAEVKRSLEASGGKKVSTIQILNELNTSVYTSIKIEDLSRLSHITREAFRDYNPEIKLMVTLLASNTTKLVGTPIEQYLPELEKVKDAFDIVAVDYYPGMWHLDPKDAESILPSDIYKAMVKSIDLLKSSFAEIATWGKEYELGEVGMRTNAPLGGSEKAQRYFYDSFFRAFKHMMVEFQEKNVRLPSRVGFYEAMDEPPKDMMGKVLRKLTPFPEHDMGMRSSEGRRKMILEGSPHASEEERAEQPSQLRKIINYLRSPVGK